jgi:hypothetical protein
MKQKLFLTITLIAGLIPVALRAADNDKWSFDTSLYGLAAGMSGDVTARGIPADLDVSFSDVMENLEFGAMGSFRIGHGHWAFTTDVIYMSLSASKKGITADLDQWLIEPTISYRLCEHFDLLAGARYNNLSGGIKGPLGRTFTGTQDWWDPIVGAVGAIPVGDKLSLNVRGDVGGFGVGSDITWQAFPYLNWQVSKRCSLQAGYRWVYTDYESGSGANKFKYDVLTQGPQVGFTVRF